MIPFTGLLFLMILLIGCLLALAKEPVWGMLTYIFVYLIPPNPDIYWWANEFPNFRWSIIVTFIWLISLFKNRGERSEIALKNILAGSLLISFLLLSIIVSFNAVDPSISFDMCYDFFRYIIVFYMIVKSLKSEKDFVALLLLFMACGLLIGYTAYGTPRDGPRLEGVGPPDSADSNSLALFFAGMIPLALPFYHVKRLTYSLITLCSLVFMTNGLILCNSRGATLGLITAFLAVIYFARLPLLRSKALLASFFMICAFLYLSDQVFWERFSTISGASETEDQGSGRLVVWQSGLKMAKDYPFGAGGQGFEILSDKYIPHEMLTIKEGVRTSHNTFLLTLIEQGFIGLGIYTWFIYSILRSLKSSYTAVSNVIKSGRTISKTSPQFIYLLVVSLRASVFCFLVGAMFSDRLYYEFIYIISAVAIAVHYYVNKTYVSTRPLMEFSLRQAR